MQTYFDVDGNQILLGSLLGKGGEASVFNIIGQPKLTAKIYRETPSTETIQKLHKLIGMPAISNTAWPLKLIFESKSASKVAGYLMPKAKGVKTWSNFNVEISRIQIKDYNYTPTFFYNMLINFVKILEDVHSAGLIIGDINDSNVLISKNGSCTVIDVDSFQVGSQFLCTVARPEFLDPRLQTASLKSSVRDEASDHFAMGVLFFQLICNGIHPHQGMGEPTSISERIKANLCIGSRFYAPPHFQHDVNKLPIAIQELFIRVFTLVPTTNHEWISALMTHKSDLESFIYDSLKLKAAIDTKKKKKGFKTAQVQPNYKPNASQKNWNIFLSKWLKYSVAGLCCLLIVKVISDGQSRSRSPIQLSPLNNFSTNKESYRTFTEQHADVFRIKANQDIELPKLKSKKKKESFKEIHKNVFRIKDNK